MTISKLDYINQRFSKATLSGHIGQRMQKYLREFEAAEGKPLDRSTGYQQCTNEKGHAAYAAYDALSELQTDVDVWGLRGW